MKVIHAIHGILPFLFNCLFLLQLQIHYDKQLGNLIVHVLQARNLAPRDNNGYSDPFVKVYLLPGRGWVRGVQILRHTVTGSETEQSWLWLQVIIFEHCWCKNVRKKKQQVFYSELEPDWNGVLFHLIFFHRYCTHSHSVESKTEFSFI